MRILIFGGRGWLGGMFISAATAAGHTIIEAQTRADSHRAVRDEIIRSMATHVISFIGRTHGTYEGEHIGTIDYLEKPGKLVENLCDNLYGPFILARECERLGVHLTYFGTGCIFEYDAAHPPRAVSGEDHSGFKEHDKPNFFGSSYSVVKGFTDRMMNEEFSTTTLNVRIRMPISSVPNPRNLIDKLLKYKKIIDLPNSATVIDDLYPALLTLMDRGTVGPINACNPGTLFPSQILQLYHDLYDDTHRWTEVSKAEVETLLGNGRSNNYLDTERIERLCPNFPHAEDSLQRIMVKYCASLPPVNSGRHDWFGADTE